MVSDLSLAGPAPVVVWVVDEAWPVCVDLAVRSAPPGAPFVLLCVADTDAADAAGAAVSGLLGRGRPERDVVDVLDRAAVASGQALLAAAADRLGRPAARLLREGRPEREVVAAAQGAALLVLARQGHLDRLGPKSLGRADRFVVDHAPCPVLLVWPGPAPGVGTLPPAPHRR